MGKTSWPYVWGGETESRPQQVSRRPNATDWDRMLAEMATDRTQILNQTIGITVALPPKTPISVSNEGLRAANCENYPQVIGLVDKNQNIQVSGIFETSGLIIGSIYYLNGSTISTIPPETGYLVQIGRAWTATELILSISRPIRL